MAKHMLNDAAPRQPEGEGLEVVAWQDAENPLYTTAERRVLHDWANNGYPIVELCRLSDHLRAIAELREVNRIQLEIATVHGAACVEIRKQRDTLRQQRDKLAGLLGECRGMVAHEVERWTRSAAILPVNANVESGLLTRIDAALAEVSK